MSPPETGAADELHMGVIGTAEAAKRLGVSDARIRALILEGRLPATKVGRDWAIDEAEVSKLAGAERKPGRPRKDSERQAN